MEDESIIEKKYVNNDSNISSDNENCFDSDSNCFIHERNRPCVMMLMSDEKDEQEKDLEDANIELD